MIFFQYDACISRINKRLEKEREEKKKEIQSKKHLHRYSKFEEVKGDNLSIELTNSKNPLSNK